MEKERVNIKRRKEIGTYNVFKIVWVLIPYLCNIGTETPNFVENYTPGLNGEQINRNW